MLIVLHTADLHLGRNRKHEDYLSQQALMLQGIIRQVACACKDNPSADIFFVISGDVFDRNQDTKRTEFVIFLTHCIEPLIQLKKAYPNLTIFITDGNHDRQPIAEEPSVLSALQGLFTDHLHFAVVKPQYVEKHSMLMLPYGGYSAREMRELIEQYRPHFVMAHECLNRMQTDTGWSPPRDQDHYIEIEDVIPDTNEVAGIFLGDIHRCQSMDKNKVSWYSGSPVTLDHGHHLPKGILHHQFKKTGDLYTRVDDPQLKSLDDPRIKVHHQLGKVFDVEKIPWEQLYQYADSYIDIVVTPEVYAEINKKMEGFFDNKQVSSSFKESAPVQVETKEEEENLIEDNYYRTLIRSWVADNLDSFSVSLKDEFLHRTEKMFEGRG
jgi:DNA repair exonuclease SbcCD nuclease subunit